MKIKIKRPRNCNNLLEYFLSFDDMLSKTYLKKSKSFLNSISSKSNKGDVYGNDTIQTTSRKSKRT